MLMKQKGQFKSIFMNDGPHPNTKVLSSGVI